MNRQVIVDTGPIVALLNGRDRHHAWAVRQFADIEPPLLTCEPVISEACFLLDQTKEGSAAVFEMLLRQAMAIRFRLDEHLREVHSLRTKYVDVPMSVADASLVRMAERFERSSVLTLDSDFVRYRKHVRHVIPLILPVDVRTRPKR